MEVWSLQQWGFLRLATPAGREYQTTARAARCLRSSVNLDRTKDITVRIDYLLCRRFSSPIPSSFRNLSEAFLGVMTSRFSAVLTNSICVDLGGSREEEVRSSHIHMPKEICLEVWGKQFGVCDGANSLCGARSRGLERPIFSAPLSSDDNEESSTHTGPISVH
jgi:hypothetical protein